MHTGTPSAYGLIRVGGGVEPSCDRPGGRAASFPSLAAAWQRQHTHCHPVMCIVSRMLSKFAITWLRFHWRR